MVVILACGSGCLASIDTQTYRIGEISFQTEFACVFCNLEAESPTPCQHTLHFMSTPAISPVLLRC